jgi:poly-gamma-glutamate capsule biosynthesis protein CapA/YwtB (metallophosphatase superfamily)
MKLAFCGDIFPANLHYTIGYGVASRFVLHKGKPWVKHIKKFFQNVDVVFGNLESPLIYNSDHPELTCFAGSEDFAYFLKQIGISIVSIANNHILEHGLPGFNSTKEILQKNGIKYVGDFQNGKPHIVIF